MPATTTTSSRLAKPLSIASSSYRASSDSSAPLSPPQSLLSGGLPASSFSSSFASTTTTTTNSNTLPSAPASLLAGALPASLLTGDANHHNSSFGSESNHHHHLWTSKSSSAPSRPRRLWTIQDTALKHIPKFYPPLDPNCTVYVGDASPSVVAVRISECFRKRSISVEYDEESITATVLTVDRCQFQVQLWKGNVTAGVDFSNGVVVECIRVSGNTISFHAACRAVLRAALGVSTGQDDDLGVVGRRGQRSRRGRRQSGLEFGSMFQQARASVASQPSSSLLPSTKGPAVSPERALEHARELLKKDRWDTQLLGMECLVNLTTPSISGNDMALHVSLHILQSDWLFPYVKLDESDLDTNVPSTTTSSSLFASCTTSLLEPSTSLDKERSVHEGKHESRLRAVALRVLCNSLSNASNAKLLHQLLNSPNHVCKALLDRQVLHSLSQDLQGANRPPSVVNAGYKLASVHEAALAVRCLRLMGEQSSVVQDLLQTEPVLERLELARACGRATHMVLQEEAERAYTNLTEDVRSC